jgi:hypothetical protein
VEGRDVQFVLFWQIDPGIENAKLTDGPEGQPRGASTVTSFIGIFFGVKAGHGMGYEKWLELPTYWLDISSLHRHGRRQLGARCSTTQS